jgi:hypothetical protein
MSYWGTAGGGAPQRTRSGQVNAKLAYGVEGDFTGATEEMKEPGYRARRDKVRKDQETHIQQRSRAKHRREAKARAEAESIAAQRTATEQTRKKALAVAADRAHIAAVEARRDRERSRAKGQAAAPVRKVRKYDPTLGDAIRPEYASRASPAAQRALGRELDKAIEKREEARKSTKMQHLREDAAHAANANRFFEATAPTFVRQANGEPTARRHLPTGEGACDYRMLSMAANNLM